MGAPNETSEHDGEEKGKFRSTSHQDPVNRSFGFGGRPLGKSVIGW